MFQSADESISGNGESVTWAINAHGSSVPCTRPGAGENGELLSNGFRVSILQNESVLKMDCGAGCTTM